MQQNIIALFCTPDISKIEQMSLIIRIVTKDDGCIIAKNILLIF